MALCLRCKIELTVSVIWGRASFGGGASLGGRGRVNELQGDSVCGSGSGLRTYAARQAISQQ